MPLEKDKNGNWIYVAPSELGVTSAPKSRFDFGSYAMSQATPSIHHRPSTADLVFSKEGGYGDFEGVSPDPKDYSNQKATAVDLVNDQKGMIETAEAQGIDTSKLSLLLGKKDTGIVNRAFDVLSRPNYAVANTAMHLLGADERTTKADDPLEAAWEGLSGHAKTTFTEEYLKRADPNKTGINKGGIRGQVGAATAGLISDIVLDPSTYLGVGAVKHAGGMLVGGGKQAEVINRTSKLGRAIQKAENPTVVSRTINAVRQAPRVAKAKGTSKVAAFSDLYKAGPAMPSAPVGRQIVRGSPKFEFVSTAAPGTKAHVVDAEDLIRHSEELLQPGKASSRKLDRIADTAVRDYRAAQKAKNLPIDPDTLKSVRANARQLAKTAAEDRVQDGIRKFQAMDKALDTTINLKFGGKAVVSTRRGGKAVDDLNRFFQSTRVGKGLKDTFDPVHRIGNRIVHKIHQTTANVSAAQWEEELRTIKRVFDGKSIDDPAQIGGKIDFARTTRKDRVAITRALEKGTDAHLPPHLRPHYAFAKDTLDELWDAKVAHGIKDPADKMTRYVPHEYRVPKNAPPQRGKPYRRAKSLDAARQWGADPRMDIAELLSLESAKTYRKINKQLMLRNMGSMFGVPQSKPLVKGAKKGSKQAKLKAAPSKLDDLNRRLLKNDLIVDGKEIDKALTGLYFDKEVAGSIRDSLKLFNNVEDLGHFMQMYDSILAKVKFVLTAPNPGFHMRNMIGDTFVNWLDGTGSVTDYNRAARVLANPTGDNVVLTNKKTGKGLRNYTVTHLYEANGLKAGYFHADVGRTVPGSKLSRMLDNPFAEQVGRGGRFVNRSMKDASEAREDYMRMAHFINAMDDEMKKGAKSWEQASELAAERVRKFNFDYQDLTQTERNVFRRVIPFYTYMRKSMPLMMSMYFTQPGKIAATDKTMRAISGAIGSTDYLEQSIPGISNVTPEWLAELNKIPLVDEGPGNDAMYMVPELPYQQFNEMFSGYNGMFDAGADPGKLNEAFWEGNKGFVKSIVDQGNPMVTNVIEQMIEKDLTSGAPVKRDAAGFIGSFVPAYNALFGDSNKDPLSQQPNYRIPGTEWDISERLLNYLTGAGIRKVSPQRIKAEVYRQNEPIEEEMSDKRKKERLGLE